MTDPNDIDPATANWLAARLDDRATLERVARAIAVTECRPTMSGHAPSGPLSTGCTGGICDYETAEYGVGPWLDVAHAAVRALLHAAGFAEPDDTDSAEEVQPAED